MELQENWLISIVFNLLYKVYAILCDIYHDDNLKSNRMFVDESDEWLNSNDDKDVVEEESIVEERKQEQARIRTMQVLFMSNFIVVHQSMFVCIIVCFISCDSKTLQTSSTNGPRWNFCQCCISRFSL
jgi:hypothetical protein